MKKARKRLAKIQGNKEIKTELDKAEKRLATTEAQTTKYEAAVKKRGAAVHRLKLTLRTWKCSFAMSMRNLRQKFDEYAEKAGKVGQAVQTAGQHMMKVTTAIGGVAAASVTVAANFEQQMSKCRQSAGNSRGHRQADRIGASVGA